MSSNCNDVGSLGEYKLDTIRIEAPQYSFAAGEYNVNMTEKAKQEWINEHGYDPEAIPTMPTQEIQSQAPAKKIGAGGLALIGLLSLMVF